MFRRLLIGPVSSDERGREVDIEWVSSRMWKGSYPATILSNMSSVVRLGSRSEIGAEVVFTNDGS